jgi:predicted amidohydrolase
MVGRERAQLARVDASLTAQADSLRVGLLQTGPTLGRVDENRARIVALGRELAEVDLVITPELSLSGFGFGSDGAVKAMSSDDARLASLGLGSAAVGIGFAEQSPAGLPRNSYVVLDGEETHLQRKLHPVSYAPWNEHLLFAAGDSLDTAVVRGARCATIICNDMWHPVVPWMAARAGAEVLIVPVASIEGEDPAQIRRTWDLIITHAATVLQCYVVFVNRCGVDSGKRFWGGSRVIGPDGDTIVELGDVEGSAVATLDLGRVRDLRARTPILAETNAARLSEALSGLALSGTERMEHSV